MKCNSICIMGIQEESIQDIENLFEGMITENFSNLVKETSHKSRKLTESQTVGPKEAYTKKYHH